MEKWKRAFDEYTQIPKCRPLPSALFINHVNQASSGGGIIETGLTVTEEHDALCKDLQERTESFGPYHVDANLNERIFETFEEFSWLI
jgi:hypothetical protein